MEFAGKSKSSEKLWFKSDYELNGFRSDDADNKVDENRFKRVNCTMYSTGNVEKVSLAIRKKPLYFGS